MALLQSLVACGDVLDSTAVTSRHDAGQDGARPADGGTDAKAQEDARDSGPRDTGPRDSITDLAEDAPSAIHDGSIGDVATPTDGQACTAPSPLLYLSAPIIPPYAAAGLDMRGGPGMNGSEGWSPADAGSFQYVPAPDGGSPLLLGQVAELLCLPASRIGVIQQEPDGGSISTVIGIPFAQYPYGYGFGVFYEKAQPNAVSEIELQVWDPEPVDGGSSYPYRGTMEATAQNGAHYSVQLGGPIEKTPEGGAPAPLVFPSSAADTGPVSAATRAVTQELYGALMTQFLPLQSQQNDCLTDGDCVVQVNVTSLDTETVFAFLPLHLQLGVRVLPGSEPWLPGNTVELIDLSAALP